VKIQRIAQNLLLNALKYTREGGVVVTWGTSGSADGDRWLLQVADTGPGFHAGPGAPLAGALEDATVEARDVEARARGTQTAPRDEPDGRAVNQRRGEGIGLSIVKRLCELLDATLEMESEPDRGSIVRVRFPRAYPDGPIS